MRKLTFIMLVLSFIATAGAQTRSDAGGQLSNAEQPTVLPTIIGVRKAPSKRAVSSSIPYPTTITAAGPVVTVSPDGTAYYEPGAIPVSSAEQVIIEAPILLRDRRYWRRVPRQYDGHKGTWRGTGWQGRRAPGLAPTPRLAPTPGEAPDPRTAPRP